MNAMTTVLGQFIPQFTLGATHPKDGDIQLDANTSSKKSTKAKKAARQLSQLPNRPCEISTPRPHFNIITTLEAGGRRRCNFQHSKYAQYTIARAALRAP